ncbi:Hypothetical protein PHPALM_37476 [Phytophthora palmivora]|uniref:Uncharacterized protein n=1 Tax=Phytophthora palmivora TaxID=4796 RepID=A0A2P4WXC3_9STRA|nr:Hypothetical protein PHPALM_37476 [Phytophthora palmivora]
MQRKLWMLWTQLGCTLDVLHCCEGGRGDRHMQLVMTSPSWDFRTHCSKEKQVAFACELWDAVLAKPLDGAPVNIAEDVALRLIEVFLHWMEIAMRGYEVPFIANVATPLREHVQVTSKANVMLMDVWVKFANLKMGTGSIIKNAASVAVTVVVALAVGLVLQRKLRILLFQCTSLIDDALAVVFSGLYNLFEPVDAFAHRFIGVCLTHLGQFTPLFTVFPHYLQVTLAAYPANASPEALTKACGAIFGSLFYSEALTMSYANDDEITETAHRMVLWAMQKCCERTTELLAEENKAASMKSFEDIAGEKVSVKESTVASETDGLYLAGVVFELMKMSPMKILKASAMEAEHLLARWKSSPNVLRELKAALFARISQNCEAEKRAWLAAWYIEIDKQYPVDPPKSTPLVASRL